MPLKAQNVSYPLLYTPEYITPNTYSTGIIDEFPESQFIYCAWDLEVYWFFVSRIALNYAVIFSDFIHKPNYFYEYY